MKLLATTILAASLAAAGAVSADIPVNGTPGLHKLATTGWADDKTTMDGVGYAEEGYGVGFDKTGGMPGAFTYTIGNNVDSVELNDFDKNIVEMQLSQARALLGANEFLAPHFLKAWDGSMVIMVAPHTLVDGMVVHGGNVDKDHFIVVTKDGIATRADFSDTYGEL